MAKKQTKEIEYNSVVYNTVLEEVLHNSMIPYAEDVILDRAIPRVEDGLKPVQRRVLYSMHEMGLTPDKPHKKCARIVGDCLGKYHPHGDSSVYGALVIMAQPFSMRMKLVDGHGNFGSVDGDGAAAMRYTEARMSPLALELLRDLDKDTVKWTPNFDDSLEEPNTLPGRFPNLFVNGAYGIAIGLATNIPTHNMGETIDACVAQIENPNITTKELLQYLKGPDFPTGGFVIPVDSLESIYDTGKGKIKIRSRVHIEKGDNGKKDIVITELPYGVNKSKLLQDIAELKEKAKEGKEKDLLNGIADIVDESDKTGIRGVIKLKKDSDANEVLRYLLQKTNLEISYSYNVVAIANGKPEQLSLKSYLEYYIEYQRQVVYRRSVFDLKAAKARAEIVKALLIAIGDIDAVIKIIKESEAPKEELKKRYDLTDPQAQAILDMRLKSLAKLEVGKLKEELAELEKKIEYLTGVIESKRKQFTVVKNELLEVKKAQNSPRCTVIIDNNDPNGGASIENLKAPSKEEAVEYRDGIITTNVDGQLRFMSLKAFNTKQKDMGSLSLKQLPKEILNVNNKGTLYAISNLGSLVKIDVTNLPEKKFGDAAFKLVSINPDVQANEYVVKLLFFEGAPVGELVIFTKNGMAKRCDIAEFGEVSKACIKAINLDDKDEVIGADIAKDDMYICEVTKDGQVLTYPKDDIPLQKKNSGGVNGIKLNDKDTVIYAGQIEEAGEIIVATNTGHVKRIISSTVEMASRYQKGVRITKLDGNYVKYVGFVKEPYDLAFVVNDQTTIMNTEDILIDIRENKGKQVFKGEVQFVSKVNEGN